ncbi:MAG: NTP/NDP exchange transporter, partial [Chlamydiia bacterium]|nr:NTP/NDP exchange transporter [Chlamydiia bacterium]
MSQNDSSGFGRIRSFLWPIHSYELKKLLPMLGIFFLISLNYNILRAMKDALVVTAKSSGAEVIPFIKVWAMLPMAFFMTYIFTVLSNHMSRERVFYAMIGIFLTFFALFAFVFYPNRDLFHPHAFADRLELILPVGMKGLIAMIRYWTFTGFYVMAELWGAIMLFLVFWGFANAVTSVHEAKRFYGLFGIGANFAGVVAGRTAIWISRLGANQELMFGESAFHQSLLMLLVLVLVSGFASIALFRWMNASVLTDPRFYDPAQIRGPKKKFKGKIGLLDSIRYLRNSPYLTCIGVIVIAYNLVINLVEVVWKHEVRVMFPDGNDYIIYMNQVTTAIGVIATLTALFVSGNVIRIFGWTATALITPMILLVTSIGFFCCFFAKQMGLSAHILLLGVAPQALVVFFGSAQNVLSRAAKYTVYDATKELAFIPLSDECKLKGKATIDGVGSRLGKSGGSIIYQALLMFCGSIAASTPFVAVILFGVIFLWIGATKNLGKAFRELTEANERAAEEEAAEE